MYVFKNRETEQVCEFDNVEAAETFQRDIPDSPKWDQLGDQVLAASPVGVAAVAPEPVGADTADVESAAALESGMDAEVVKAAGDAPSV